MNPNTPYHLSARSNNRDWFQLPMNEVWDITSRYLRFIAAAYSVQIHNFVLMSNHYHLIASFPEANMPQALQYFMRETSRSIAFESKRINHIYGGRYFRSQILTYNHFLTVYKYVYRNPVEARIVDVVEEYPYSSLNSLLGQSQIIFPVAEDTLLFDNISRNLEWMNKAPLLENYETVRKALRRDVFTLPMVADSSEPHPLEIELY